MKIIDLTQAMTNGMPVMAGITPPEFRDLADVATDGYAMSQYTFINHTGTHVDAPAHQIAGGASLDDIPLGRLVTDALTIDLTGHDPGPVGPAGLGGALDQVRPGDIVLLRSDNAANWGTDAYWHGWCYPDAAATRALIDRGVSGVGFDGPSADRSTAWTSSCTRCGWAPGRSSSRTWPAWPSCRPAVASSSPR